jgi:ubiquinone/menaquinone biosynthesis C-methylase UbiE
MATPYYTIRGGLPGRERLRILSRVMQPTSLTLFRRVGVGPGMACLEVGCGGGDVALDLARMVGPEGNVIGTDIDPVKLEIARREARAGHVANVEYRPTDITKDSFEEKFDFVHARFLLTHLPNPGVALAKMWQALRPGGIVVLEDIDFRAHFCHPDCPAFWRYIELYSEIVKRRGGDANIGPRLPSLLSEAQFENIQMNVVQPAGISGEVKLMAPLTMENIADAVVAEGLTDRTEVENLVVKLYEYACTPYTVSSMPRVVEAWGCRSKP